MKIDRTKIILFSVKLLIAIIISLVVAYNIDSIKLKLIVKNANITYIVFAIVLLPINLYLQFAKWKYLVDKTTEKKATLMQIWSSVILGIGFGFITPGRVGELGKLFIIKNADRYKLLSMSIIEKIYDTFPVIFFGIISLPFLPHNFFTGSALLRTNLIILAFVISFILYFVGCTFSN